MSKTTQQVLANEKYCDVCGCILMSDIGPTCRGCLFRQALFKRGNPDEL